MSAMTRTSILLAAKNLLGCDDVEIREYDSGNKFLIACYNRNTRQDEKCQWYKNDKPVHFDYVERKCIANGKMWAELWESVKFYHDLKGKEWVEVLTTPGLRERFLREVA